MKATFTLLGFLLVCSTTSTLYAQDSPPPIEWQKSHERQNNVYYSDQLFPTPSGGFVSTSNATGFLLPNRGVILYNSTGEIVRHKNFNSGSTTSNFTFNRINALADGSFIIAGTVTDSSGIFTGIPSRGKADAFLLKLNDTLGIEWLKRYGGPEADEFRNVIPVAGGGYLAIGTAKAAGGDVTAKSDSTWTVIPAYPSGTTTIAMSDWWVVRVDDAGTIIRDKCFGGNEGGDIFGIEQPSGVLQTSTGNFIISGSSTSSDLDISNPVPFQTHNRSSMWFLNLNDTLGIVWDKSIGGSGLDQASGSILELPDGNIIVSGNSSSVDGNMEDLGHGGGQYVYDVFLAKLAITDGAVMWANCYGGSASDALASNAGTDNVKFADDGNLIFTANTASPDGDIHDYKGGDTDLWLVKVNVNTGDTLWSKTYGGSHYDTGNSLIANPDGSLIVYGVTNSTDTDLFRERFYSSTGGSAWIMKLAACSSSIVRNVEMCPGDTMVFNGITITQSGTFFDTTGTVGCPYYETLKITLRDSYTPEITSTATNQLVSADTFFSYQWTMNGRLMEVMDGMEIRAEGTANYGLIVVDEYACKSDTGYYAFAFDGCEAPQTYWTKSYGGNGVDEGNSIAPFNGGYLITGRAASSNGYVHGLHGTTGQSDMWVVKIAENGDTLYTRALGGGHADEGNAIRPTPDGGFIVLGTSTYSDLYDMGDANGPRPVAASGKDLWILKFDANNTIEWQQLYGGSGADVAASVEVLTDGYIVSGSLPNQSTNGTATGLTAYGSNDGWILKLNLDGTINWQKRYGGGGIEYIHSIIPTSDGGYIAAGQSAANANTGSLGTTVRPGASNDGWVLKLDANGDIEWQKLFGGAGSDILYAIRPTADGGYIASGFAAATSTAGTFTGMPRLGGNDFWTIKLDASGTIQWQKLIGGTGSDQATATDIIVDADGYVFAGFTASSNGDVVETNVSGGNEFWVVKTDLDGDITWHKTLGGKTNDQVNSIAVANGGGYIVAGQTSNNSKISDAFGAADVFVAKIAECTACTTFPAQPVLTICEGDSVSVYGNYVKTTGVYNDTTATSGVGCHYELEAVTLNVIPRKYTHFQASLCEGESYTFQGTQYNTSGIYRDTLQSAATGCDSIIVLTINVAQSIISTRDYAICAGSAYVFGGATLTQAGVYSDTLQSTVTGCDSIIVLTLTVADSVLTDVQESICQGESFLFAGQTLTAAGSYNHTYQSQAGCDSIVTLTLSVNALPVPTITASGNTLSTGVFDAYQWFFNGTEITGATSQNYTAAQSGNYHVEVTNNDCKGESQPFNLNVLSIEALSDTDFSLYPNPTKGIVNVVFKGEGTYQVTDVAGKFVQSGSLSVNGTTPVDLSHLENGVYLIHLNSNNRETVIRHLVKE